MYLVFEKLMYTSAESIILSPVAMDHCSRLPERLMKLNFLDPILFPG